MTFSVMPSGDSLPDGGTRWSAAAGAAVVAEDFGLTPAGSQVPVLDGLDFRVEPGQIVLLTGPSGAGKSTLLHALAGVLEPEEADGNNVDPEAPHGIRMSGSLTVDGKQPSAGRAGLVQQDPETQVVMARMGDDVAFGAENLGTDPAAIWPRVRASLAAVGLGTQPLNHSTNALSGGQKQRLAVAGLLTMGPRLWLLDEPTANLDPEGAEELRRVVVSTARDLGATVMVVEHRLDLWLGHVDRLMVLAAAEPGEPAGLVADGNPAELLGRTEVVETLVSAGVRVPGRVPGAAVRPLGSRPDGDVLLSARDLSATRAALPRRAGKRTKVSAAVEHVDLDVRAGEAVCLVGSNGQGKTALALTLAGLQRKRSGDLTATEALLGGTSREPERLKPKELVQSIGMVFQDPEHQFLTRNVRAELAFGPRRVGLDQAEIEARVESLLRRLHLEHVAELNPYQLSGGQQRRLSVGTALATRPRLLVLDEPTFGQDANTWGDLVRLLGEELDRGTGIIAVTHDKEFSAALGARRVLVEAGRAEEVGAA